MRAPRAGRVRPLLYGLGKGILLGCAVAASTLEAAADERPSEDKIFGTASPERRQAPDAQADPRSRAQEVEAASTSGQAEAVVPRGTSTERDAEVLGNPSSASVPGVSRAPEDPLAIGGRLYLRAFAQGTAGQALGDAYFSAPALLDTYLDARPNDRVRGFVLGRLFFDSAAPSRSASPGAPPTTGVGTGNSAPLVSGAQGERGPVALLDQLWLSFDVERAVFITVGRQHVRWGTGRFWAPTDYLHDQYRNPLDAFDARGGLTMLKINVPWEELGWNFYAFAVMEGVMRRDRVTARYTPGSDASNALDKLGIAARAEVTLGAAEVGVDIVAHQDQKPRYGADLSLGLGEFDLYADLGLRHGSELPRRRVYLGEVPPVAPPFESQAIDAWVDTQYPIEFSNRLRPQLVIGATYSLVTAANDVLTLTGEYFENSVGYEDSRIYPGLLLSGAFTFFYVGRRYAALAATLSGPRWGSSSFGLSTLGNLSDRSFITRLDYSLLVLTHLRFEAFGTVNYGRREGEFRLGSRLIDPTSGDTLRLAPQSFGVGLGLSIDL